MFENLRETRPWRNAQIVYRAPSHGTAPGRSSSGEVGHAARSSLGPRRGSERVRHGCRDVVSFLKGQQVANEPFEIAHAGPRTGAMRGKINGGSAKGHQPVSVGSCVGRHLRARPSGREGRASDELRGRKPADDPRVQQPIDESPGKHEERGEQDRERHGWKRWEWR